MGDQIIDLRELAQTWRDALDMIDNDAPDDYVSEREQCAALEALCGELGIDATPDALERQGEDTDPTLIREDRFENYARELAEDIGAISGNESWPLSCIDWERAARELAMDYMLVSFDGDDYYYRS